MGVEPSDWLGTLSNLPDDTQHFRVFFDEVGCYDIAAQQLQVEGDRDDLEE